MILWKLLLTNKERNECNQVFEIINQITIARGNKHNDILTKNLFNCTIEHIQTIKDFNKDSSVEELVKLVLNKIVPLFSKDFMLFINCSYFKTNYSTEINTIFNIYNKGKHQNISQYLTSTTRCINIIYTYSSINDKLILPTTINNEFLGEISLNLIEQDLSKEARNEHALII